jgi:hypothetical protein
MTVRDPWSVNTKRFTPSALAASASEVDGDPKWQCTSTGRNRRTVRTKKPSPFSASSDTHSRTTPLSARSARTRGSTWLRATTCIASPRCRAMRPVATR